MVLTGPPACGSVHPVSVQSNECVPVVKRSAIRCSPPPRGATHCWVTSEGRVGWLAQVPWITHVIAPWGHPFPNRIAPVVGTKPLPLLRRNQDRRIRLCLIQVDVHLAVSVEAHLARHAMVVPGEKGVAKDDFAPRLGV